MELGTYFGVGGHRTKHCLNSNLAVTFNLSLSISRDRLTEKASPEEKPREPAREAPGEFSADQAGSFRLSGLGNRRADNAGPLIAVPIP